MRMKVNVLDSITGEVSSIKYKNGQWRSVAYLSKSLNEIKRSYEIYNKKMLVVIKELENWKCLLESMKLKFEV